MKDLGKKFQETIWVSKSLFERNKTSGSSANISFRDNDKIYISGSGTCFGILEKKDFAITTLDGTTISDIKPSKELSLHLALYNKSDKIQAVIHTHSLYSTLWSILKHKNEDDIIANITPYLQMKVGKISLIKYFPPGSKELFAEMKKRINSGDGFLLQNHGSIVGGESIMEAFFGLEELEESAKISWFIRLLGKDEYNHI
ncbi:MAG: class II aldolase/adducin family protein [Fusobacteriaceae bacterium]|jgi:ribulose-5-phosphate 4-epimerase/fuculose-1-phosphate aldolase|nr:class II aldolase/adducin family protein [Fusobacteriaceae bacterium]